MQLRAGKRYFTNIDNQVLHEPGSLTLRVIDTNNGTELPVTVTQVSKSLRTNGTKWFLTRGGKAMGHNRRVIFKIEGEVQ